MKFPPRLHLVHFPSFGIRAGDPVTFKVRAFETTEGEERWDFGDGSPAATTRSDGNAVKHALDGYAVLTHRFRRPGDFIVTVRRSRDDGVGATVRVHVRVEPND